MTYPIEPSSEGNVHQWGKFNPRCRGGTPFRRITPGIPDYALSWEGNFRAWDNRYKQIPFRQQRPNNLYVLDKLSGDEMPVSARSRIPLLLKVISPICRKKVILADQETNPPSTGRCLE
ncbi:hypothetical protein [Methanoculleus sp.]|uniref:hypothetical protein n=1 Tax=Methanoculleus sp. TaxID=90427 RepID=UPI0025F2E5FF|nr:hypothetical protein [Methanoculleus sp.]